MLLRNVRSWWYCSEIFSCKISSLDGPLGTKAAVVGLALVDGAFDFAFLVATLGVMTAFDFPAATVSLGLALAFVTGLGDASSVKSKAVDMSSLVRAFTSIEASLAAFGVENGIGGTLVDFFALDGAPTFLCFLDWGLGDLNGMLPILFS